MASRLPLTSFVALCVATLILSAFAAGPSTLPGDVRIARFIQRWDFAPLQRLADFGNGIGATAMGITIWLALLLSSVALRRNRDSAFLVVLGFLRALGALLKDVLTSPRPSSPFIHLSGHFNGYGFPSGHTFTATCIGGAILLIAARRIRRRSECGAVYVLAIAIPLVTGFARVYVGAHWPSDVLGGWLWGIITVVAAWWLSRYLLRRVTPTGPPAAP